MKVRTPFWMPVGLLLLAAQSGLALPIQVSIGSFTSPTVIDFNAIGNEVAITNQFAGSGVTFSGGIWGMTNGGDLLEFTNPGAAIASDWLYSLSAHGTLPITATFSSIQNLVGFFTEVNTGDTTVITTFLNGNPNGSVSLASINTTAVFFGVSDAAGFNSITIDVTGSSNHFIGLDNFQFQGGAVSATPEPSSVALIGVGLLALAAVGRKRRILGRKS